MQPIFQRIRAYIQKQQILLHFETIQNPKMQLNYCFLKMASKGAKTVNTLNNPCSIQ